MTKQKRFLVFLIPLAIISGYLLSRASWIGRTGINLFYQQYKFLKVWWQASMVVFIAWLILFLIQAFIINKCTRTVSLMVQTTLILACFTGAYFTYQDFHENLAHRLLGRQFHWGAYLFWLGCLVILIQNLYQQKLLQKNT